MPRPVARSRTDLGLVSRAQAPRLRRRVRMRHLRDMSAPARSSAGSTRLTAVLAARRRRAAAIDRQGESCSRHRQRDRARREAGGGGGGVSTATRPSARHARARRARRRARVAALVGAARLRLVRDAAAVDHVDAQRPRAEEPQRAVVESVQRERRRPQRPRTRARPRAARRRRGAGARARRAWRQRGGVVGGRGRGGRGRRRWAHSSAACASAM